MATFNKIAWLESQLEAKISQLNALNATMLDTCGSDVLEFRFDDGIGSQRSTKHEMREIRKNVQILEAEIESLSNRLAGLGVVNIALRRRS